MSVLPISSAHTGVAAATPVTPAVAPHAKVAAPTVKAAATPDTDRPGAPQGPGTAKTTGKAKEVSATAPTTAGKGKTAAVAKTHVTPAAAALAEATESAARTLKEAAGGDRQAQKLLQAHPSSPLGHRVNAKV